MFCKRGTRLRMRSNRGMNENWAAVDGQTSFSIMESGR